MNVFYYLLPVALAIATKVLHHLYLNAAGFMRKACIMAGLTIFWMGIVYWLAHYFCSFAQTMEQCFLLWSAAFGVGCIFAVMQVFILLLCRNKRDVSELDRMKLRDM